MVPRTVIWESASDGCGLPRKVVVQTPGDTPTLHHRPTRWHALRAGLLSGWLLITALAGGLPQDVMARSAPTPSESTQANTTVALSSLPQQARDVHQRIRQGGPFRYSQDGVVFGNRERLLPRRPRGYYHEYTVPTPGARNRGARRIVCGGKEVRLPETCFYTSDHYQSFQQIDPLH